MKQPNNKQQNKAKPTAKIEHWNNKKQQFEPIPQRNKNSKTVTVFETANNAPKTVEIITKPFRQIAETANRYAQIVPPPPVVLPPILSEITKTIQRLTDEHETAKNNVFYQLAIDELEAKEKQITELTEKINTARRWLTIETTTKKTKQKTLEFSRTETEKREMVLALSKWLVGDIWGLFNDDLSDNVRVEVQPNVKQIDVVFAFGWLIGNKIIRPDCVGLIEKHVYFKGKPLKNFSNVKRRTSDKTEHQSPEQREIAKYFKSIFR